MSLHGQEAELTPETQVTGSPRSLQIQVPPVAPDPRHEWSMAKARLGGNAVPVGFSELQKKVIDAVADEIIPSAPGWPAPSEVRIAEFVARYVTPVGQPVRYYPFAAEDQFKRDLDALGQEFSDAPAEQKIARLKELEAKKPEFFEQLKGLTYYGYYAQPEIVKAIRENLPAGRDYHGPPQPYGYLEVTEEWGDTRFPHGRGSFVPTDRVRRVDIPESLRLLYAPADGQDGR
jgi:hypothetical protein